ncbi:hypothetical protein LTR62_004627 [Meristemomyces frigidus]|uniref:Cytochrome c oxidase subunit n=1 Tax=Meristemomyces frigidus TaxID=1508187 RepID=A0AAN7YP13_9PEZI|nr:hypothetical protein LTR62_004627 [Meristemomyces frigidus]
MIGLRAFQRTAASPALRQQIRAPRRFASTQAAEDNAFNRERAAVKQHAAESSEPRTLIVFAYSVVIPCLCIAGVNAYRLWNEHWEHVAHGPSLEEKPEYAYQNIRTKNYFWGDGDKTLFWNDKVNYHKQDEE